MNQAGATGERTVSIMYFAPELESNADYIFLPNKNLSYENKDDMFVRGLKPANLLVAKGRDRCDGETFRFAFNPSLRSIVNYQNTTGLRQFKSR